MRKLLQVVLACKTIGLSSRSLFLLCINTIVMRNAFCVDSEYQEITVRSIEQFDERSSCSTRPVDNALLITNLKTRDSNRHWNCSSDVRRGSSDLFEYFYEFCSFDE